MSLDATASDSKPTDFLLFCSIITGYSCFDLAGTGLVDLHRGLVDAILGAKADWFYADVRAVVQRPPEGWDDAVREKFPLDSPGWQFVANLMTLWFLGGWNALPQGWYDHVGLPYPGPGDPGATHVPSVEAYIEQLAYRTAQAHPPGAKPTGFGGWSLLPEMPAE